MAQSYETYRTSPSQFERYRNVIIEFLKNPRTTVFIPETISPKTACVDLRALFIDMNKNPLDYLPMLPDFTEEQLIGFFADYALKVNDNDSGVYCAPRLRKTQFRMRARVNPYARQRDVQQPLIVSTDQPSKLKVEFKKPQVISYGNSHEPLGEPSKSTKPHVENTRVLHIACAAVQEKLFSKPIEFQGIMSLTQKEDLNKKFPELEFIDKENSTIIL